MLDALVVIFVSSVASIGLIDILKTFLPENIDKVLMTVISIIIEVAVSVALFTVFPPNSFGTVWTVLQYCVVVLATVGITQFEYPVIKLIKMAINKLKK